MSHARLGTSHQQSDQHPAKHALRTRTSEVLQNSGNNRAKLAPVAHDGDTVAPMNTSKVRAKLVTELTLVNQSVPSAGDTPSWNNSV